MTLKEAKHHVRTFMQKHYTNDRLVELLEHARSGKLSYYSCCCFIGIATATHELRAQTYGANHEPHYRQAAELPDAGLAEKGFYWITREPEGFSNYDEKRRRILIPMVKAEIRRRFRAANPQGLPLLERIHV